jgi:hypothetical protein
MFVNRVLRRIFGLKGLCDEDGELHVEELRN